MALEKARVLKTTHIDGVEFQPDQVIEADALLIKELEKAGAVDSDPGAVKYCMGEGVKVITHQLQTDAAAAQAQADAIANLQAEIEQLKGDFDAATKKVDKEAITAAAQAKQAELDALLAAA